MSTILLSALLTLQAQTPTPPAPQSPLRNESAGGRDITPAHETYGENFTTSDARARIAIQSYGACAAGGARAAAADVLRRDFRTRQYQQGLQVLSRNNQDCFRHRGRMSSHNLLFAGAMAEHLIERSAEPLNVRLARAAAGPPTQGFSPTDRVAVCVVRSVPDDVARLFATEVASEAETQAAQGLTAIVGHCNAERQPIEVSPAGLRAMLATAAFRTLNPASTAEARN